MSLFCFSFFISLEMSFLFDYESAPDRKGGRERGREREDSAQLLHDDNNGDCNTLSLSSFPG